jgi:hypothetical protein
MHHPHLLRPAAAKPREAMLGSSSFAVPMAELAEVPLA